MRKRGLTGRHDHHFHGLEAVIEMLFVFVMGQVKELELPEIRSDYRALMITSELDRRIVDFLILGEKEGLRDAIIKAVKDQK